MVDAQQILGRIEWRYRALSWLRGHLSEPIDLELLADVAGVRPRTLETHFKTFLRTTPARVVSLLG